MLRFIIPLLLLRIIFSGHSGTVIPSKISSDDSVTATDSILHSWLGKQTVENDHPRFKSLWFFVNAKELDSISESRSLLRTFKFEGIFQQQYFFALNDREFDQQPLAGILRSSDKLRMRTAWSSYWPMVYYDQPGNQLVQVFMDDSALVVAFQPGEKFPFRVYDVSGNSISLPEAIKRERHIAVVFFYGKMKSTGTYRRTFFIVNEQMIRHWQHATPSMQDGIIKDLNYLLLLEAWVKEKPEHVGKAGKKGKNILSAWNALPEKRSVVQKVFACHRSTEKIDFNEKNLKATIDFIRQMWPLQVKPMEKFPSKGIR